MRHASIPTPTISAVEIGSLTIHFYALCIIAGIAVAIWLGNKRFTQSRPDVSGVVADVAIFAIPAGVIGGRLYHVLTSPEKYFGESGNLFDILKIWKGGLGIWGAIALGTTTAYLSYRKIGRRRQLPPFTEFADALAPALLMAQAIGRWGNWFNGELFGRPLDKPWALEIPERLRPVQYLDSSTFHPTFLYESLWCALVALLLISLRHSLPSGSLFSLYVIGYGIGRFFIEGVRVDPAHSFGGIRLNQYVALLVVVIGAAAFAHFRRTKR